MKLVETLKEMPHSEDASVNQRFLVAILQKISIKTDSIPILVDLKVIDWSIDFISRSLRPHGKESASELSSGLIFALDFDSALLANVLHAKTTQIQMQEDQHRDSTAKIITNLLNLINNPKMPTSVLMHLLISL